jgi:hypothetical protein
MKLWGEYPKFTIDLLFEPRYIWVGGYWRKSKNSYGFNCFELYITIIPTFPIRFIRYYM